MVVWTAVQPSPPSEGPAPAFELSDLEGQTVALATLSEPVVVLNFWATWCGPCVAEIPELNEFHKENPSVGMVGISIDDGFNTAALKVQSKKVGITYTVLHDMSSKVASAYGISGVPVTFVLDEKREIRKVFVGSISKRQLQAAVDAI